jgi:hypothetical protein
VPSKHYTNRNNHIFTLRLVKDSKFHIQKILNISWTLRNSQQVNPSEILLVFKHFRVQNFVWMQSATKCATTEKIRHIQRKMTSSFGLQDKNQWIENKTAKYHQVWDNRKKSPYPEKEDFPKMRNLEDLRRLHNSELEFKRRYFCMIRNTRSKLMHIIYHLWLWLNPKFLCFSIGKQT